MFFSAPVVGGYADVTARRSVTHLTLPPRVSLPLSASDNDSLATLFTKKAQRSIAHLTFANTFWYSVPTCSVLSRTEAGGTPAFQSFAASRQLSAVADIGGLLYRCVFRSTVFGLLRSPKTLFTKKAQRSVAHLTLPSGSRLPTLHLPTRLGVQFKLFWFYYTQRRAGRPRSSPSPLRGYCRLRRRVTVWYINTFSAPLFSSCFARRKHNRPAVGWLPYDHQCFSRPFRR
jgi:hypothetical protein